MDFRNNETKVGRRISLRSADVISSRRFSPFKRGGEAKTGNTSTLRRLQKDRIC